MADLGDTMDSVTGVITSSGQAGPLRPRRPAPPPPAPPTSSNLSSGWITADATPSVQGSVTNMQSSSDTGMVTITSPGQDTGLAESFGGAGTSPTNGAGGANVQHGRRRGGAEFATSSTANAFDASGPIATSTTMAAGTTQGQTQGRSVRRAADTDWDGEPDIETIPTLETEVGEDGEAVSAAPKGYSIHNIGSLADLGGPNGGLGLADTSGSGSAVGSALGRGGYRLPAVTDEGIDLSALQVVLSSYNKVVEEDEVWTFEGVMEEVEAEVRRLGEHFVEDDDDEENVEANRASIMARLASTHAPASPMKSRHHDTGLGTLNASSGNSQHTTSGVGSSTTTASGIGGNDALPVFGGGNLGFGTPSKGRDRRL